MAGKYVGFDQLNAASAVIRKVGRTAGARGGAPSGGAASQLGKAGTTAAQAGSRAGGVSATPLGPPRARTYIGGTQVNQTGNARNGLSFRQYVDAAHPGMVMHEYTINGERHVIPVPVSKSKPGLRY